MAKRKTPAVDPEELFDPTDTDVSTGHTHNTRTDPDMRDGDSARGNPGEGGADEITTDNDVGDELEGGPPYSGHAGGATGGTPAERRAKGGRKRGGISSSGSSRGDSTVGGR
jgi:hypothetical protein